MVNCGIIITIEILVISIIDINVIPNDVHLGIFKKSLIRPVIVQSAIAIIIEAKNSISISFKLQKINIDISTEQEKIESEYEAARNYPEELRRIRNGLLAVCDWTQNRDVTLANNSDWVTYRQQLRDLPATITNANTRKSMVNNRSHSSWPTKPS